MIHTHTHTLFTFLELTAPNTYCKHATKHVWNQIYITRMSPFNLGDIWPVCLFTWVRLSDWSLLKCIHQPFQLIMASSPFPVSPSFSLLSSLPLHYPECLIMDPAFWEHVNMPAAPLARTVVLLCADWMRGKGHGWYMKKALVVTIALQDDCRPELHTPPTCLEDMVKIPTDSQNTNTLRHMTHPLTSSTKDFHPLKDGNKCGTERRV